MKRIVFILVALCSLMLLASCGHTHTYKAEWEYDESNHWHAASCKHTDKKGELAPHADDDSDGACDVCGYAETHVHTYDTTKWEYDDMNHWHAATCEHTGQKDSLAAHIDTNSDNLCDVCEYDMTAPTPAFDSTASVLPVKGGAGGIVVIVHDDGLIATGNMLDELYLEYGLVGDVAMQVNNISNNPAALSGWQALIENGRWKVVSHSMTHTWWGTGSGSTYTGDNETKLYDEVVGSQEALRGYFPGQRVLTFAYPGFYSERGIYGSSQSAIKSYIWSENARELIAEHYISARNCELWNAATVTDIPDPYMMDGFFLTTANINGGSLRSKLELAANGGIQIISLHALTPNSTSSDGYYLPRCDMENACEMISGYINQGRVWNTHYEDAILYVTEAAAASVSVTGDESSITVTLTDTLDDDIYSFPLTVRVTVPESWVAANMTVGNTTKYLEAKEVDGEWVIDADIVPDGGAVTLAPTEKHEHTYSDEWTSDTTHHWHDSDCDIHESCATAVKNKDIHLDQNSDGVCDHCRCTLSVIIPVENGDNLTHTVPADAVAVGESVTFTVSVDSPDSVRVTGATQVGEPTTLGNTKTYTFKINKVDLDSSVSIYKVRFGQVSLVSYNQVWKVGTTGYTEGGTATTVVYEKDGSFSTTDNGGTKYTVEWYNYGTSGPNADGTAYNITKRLEIKSIKVGDSTDEATITWNGNTYAKGDIVMRTSASHWLGISEFAGWAAPSVVFAPAVTAPASDGRVATFEAKFKFELGDCHWGGSYYVAKDIVSLVVRDGAANNKITSGFTVDGGPSNYLDVKRPGTSTYSQSGTTGRGRVGAELTVRFEISESNTAGKYEVRTLVDGVLIDTATVDAFDVTTVKLENINAQTRDVTITVSDVIFIKYTN